MPKLNGNLTGARMTLENEHALEQGEGPLFHALALRAQNRPAQHTEPPQYRRQVVQFRSCEKTGSIIINTREKLLYLVLPGEKAIRYGIGVGRLGFTWSGNMRVGRKAEWPKWRPTDDMIKRDPSLARYIDGMEGGPRNPLGARALYLYQGSRDSTYRIHGTNEDWSIGCEVSSGCFRMKNEHIIELHDLVHVGAKVVVRN